MMKHLLMKWLLLEATQGMLFFLRFLAFFNFNVVCLILLKSLINSSKNRLNLLRLLRQNFLACVVSRKRLLNDIFIKCSSLLNKLRRFLFLICFSKPRLTCKITKSDNINVKSAKVSNLHNSVQFRLNRSKFNAENFLFRFNLDLMEFVIWKCKFRHEKLALINSNRN